MFSIINDGKQRFIYIFASIQSYMIVDNNYSINGMLKQQLSPEQLSEIFRILTNKLSMSKAEILNHYISRGHDIEHDLSEHILKGYKISSEATLRVQFPYGSYNFSTDQNICKEVYLFFDDTEMLNECVRYCEENYPLITNNTWLVDPDRNEDKFYVLFLFTRKDDKGEEESYFGCTLRTNLRL